MKRNSINKLKLCFSYCSTILCRVAFSMVPTNQEKAQLSNTINGILCKRTNL